MEAAVATWIREGMELSFQGDFQAGLFMSLSDCRLFKGFTVVNKTTGQSPAVGRVFSFDQYNAVVDLDNDVNGGDRVAVLLDRMTAFGAF